MTDPRSSLPELLAATGFAYTQCDVPAGVTLDEWRRTRDRARRAAQIAEDGLHGTGRTATTREQARDSSG